MTRAAMAEAMTTDGFSRLMKASEYTVRKWCRDGVVPARKVGRRWYVLRKAYDDIEPSGCWSNR